MYTVAQMSTVTSAIELIGLTPLAKRAGLYPSAVQKWRDQGRLPRTELMGLTHYAGYIEELSQGKYRAADLIAETRAAWQRRAAKGIRAGRRVDVSLS